jgi:Protein of unknown function (DUF1236)
MKSQFLVAAAIAALLAGTGAAAAQGKDQHHGGAPAAQHAAPAPHPSAGARAPAAPRAPAVVHAPSAPRAPVARAPAEHRVTSTPTPKAQTQVRERSRIDRETNRTVTQRREENRNMRVERTERGTVGLDRNERGRRGLERNERGTVGLERSDRERREIGRSRGRSVSLNSEQRTRIRETILHDRRAPRASHVDFNVRVGSRIPRNRLRFVELLPLPQTIVDIEPVWQGYLYFLVGDEIVVVDPDTYEIVAVLPA